MAKTYLKDLAKKVDLEGLAQQSELADYAKTSDVEDEYLKKSGGTLTGTLTSGNETASVRIVEASGASILEIGSMDAGTYAAMNAQGGALQILVSDNNVEELFTQPPTDYKMASIIIPNNGLPFLIFSRNGSYVQRQIPTSNNKIYFNVTADGILEVTYGEDASLPGGGV